MSKYIKCKPRTTYTLECDNKVVYSGEDEDTLIMFMGILLERKRGDFYVIETTRKRYMLLDDEDLEKGNTKNNEKK